MTSQQQNYIRYGSAESEPEGLRDFVEEEEEKELKCLGFRPQSRPGECEGCKMICYECERLVIVEEEEEEDIEEEEEESDNFIKWSQSDFVDRDTCYFCGVGAGNCWVVGGEDAVCCGCEEKWRYDENKDGYIKKE